MAAVENVCCTISLDVDHSVVCWDNFSWRCGSVFLEFTLHDWQKTEKTCLKKKKSRPLSP